MLLASDLNDTGLQSHFVVSAAVLSDGMQVVANPEVKPLKSAQGADTHVGQFIFDARRHFREVIAGNQSIALKVAERACQHALRDTVHLLFER